MRLGLRRQTDTPILYRKLYYLHSGKFLLKLELPVLSERFQSIGKGQHLINVERERINLIWSESKISEKSSV